MQTRSVVSVGLLLGVAALCAAAPVALAGDDKQGVYEYVVQSAQGEFEELSEALATSARESGWRILARVTSGVPEGCSYRAQVLVIFKPAYAQQIMKINSKTGPFAVVDRVNLFEDEAGTHVATTNPLSISRTVLMDDPAYREISVAHRAALRELITAVVPGTASQQAFGKIRKRGHIGRTFGVMAGGPFEEKIKDEASEGGDDWRGLAARVRQGLEEQGPKWGLKLAYQLELPEHETVVFGSTGTPLDSKSYNIVKAGGDKSRRPYEHPGLAHAAAYPVEVVVAREGERVVVRLVDVMYRMKMYFEDAGKWAFMKNMGMPGSIHDELETQIENGLASEARTVATTGSPPTR